MDYRSLTDELQNTRATIRLVRTDALKWRRDELGKAGQELDWTRMKLDTYIKADAIVNH
ncbi:MAG: hypothetical protein V3U60_06680 [Gammaproteobacteria bacterium]